MIRDDCPTGLIVKERRNELSPLERRALQVHLAKCASCRAWQQIGRDFDSSAVATADDAAIVQRIVASVRDASIAPTSRVMRPKAARSTKPVHWILLAALASSAAAAAAVTGWQIAREIPPPEVDRALTENLADAARRTPMRTERNESQAAGETLVADGRSQDDLSVEDVTQSKPLRPTAGTAIPSGESNSAIGGSNAAATALSMYREANQARRNGDVSRAIALFRQLQQTFPRSAEARLSNVALGGALLDSGAIREALQQYDRYLASNGQKALAAEALYGRARALGKLSNRTEERATWQRLTREFPRSPYSATAARRLEALK